MDIRFIALIICVVSFFVGVYTITKEKRKVNDIVFGRSMKLIVPSIIYIIYYIIYVL